MDYYVASGKAVATNAGTKEAGMKVQVKNLVPRRLVGNEEALAAAEKKLKRLVEDEVLVKGSKMAKPAAVSEPDPVPAPPAVPAPEVEVKGGAKKGQ